MSGKASKPCPASSSLPGRKRAYSSLQATHHVPGPPHVPTGHPESSCLYLLLLDRGYIYYLLIPLKCIIHACGDRKFMPHHPTVVPSPVPFFQAVSRTSVAFRAGILKKRRKSLFCPGRALAGHPSAATRTCIGPELCRCLQPGLYGFSVCSSMPPLRHRMALNSRLRCPDMGSLPKAPLPSVQAVDILIVADIFLIVASVLVKASTACVQAPAHHHQSRALLDRRRLPSISSSEVKTSWESQNCIGIITGSC